MIAKFEFMVTVHYYEQNASSCDPLSTVVLNTLFWNVDVMAGLNFLTDTNTRERIRINFC